MLGVAPGPKCPPLLSSLAQGLGLDPEGGGGVQLPALLRCVLVLVLVALVVVVVVALVLVVVALGLLLLVVALLPGLRLVGLDC